MSFRILPQKTLLLLTIVFITACGSDTTTETDVQPTSLRIYAFNCGGIRFENLEFFSISNDETDVRDVVVPCYVIEHEKGRLLWDGGLPSSMAEVEGWQGEGMQMRLDKTFSEQLLEMGLDMSSFDFVAYSHMHFDHMGVANEVQGATLIIQQAEYDAMFADEVTVPGADASIYSNLMSAPAVKLNGDHDVFGDGRVKIISAPGHTPGHQVLFIDLENTGPIVLSGDLYHFRISRADRRVPTFNVDADMTLASMDRVEAFIAETGATLWIEHDLANFQELNQPPEYHD